MNHESNTIDKSMDIGMIILSFKMEIETSIYIKDDINWAKYYTLRIFKSEKSQSGNLSLLFVPELWHEIIVR